ncbi:dimethylamine corrinoid protein 3 [bacterium]|nr:MAG: dimethylamine corrinoid protein 3 [bacterium]
MNDLYEECAKAIIDLDGDRAEELARRSIDEERPVLETIEKGFVRGIREVGRLWEEGEIFLPELVVGAEAMKRAMAVLEPRIAAGKKELADTHRVVIGTIQGDIHDIGKTLVATMLSANGFEVHDLGADVPIGRFVEEAIASNADFIAISALLTTTMPGQKRVVEEIEKRAMRDKVRVVVGGAPCSSEWAAEIGADGYAGDAVSAVNLVKQLATAS